MFLLSFASKHQAMTARVHQDSVVVDGQRYVYLADVLIDTSAHQKGNFAKDWWLGLQWDRAINAPFQPGGVSSSSLASNRPLFQLERQQTMQNGLSRWGLRLEYFQPWVLRRSEVSEDVKGWIESESAAIRILTVHKSKGLEYPITFLPFLGFSTEPKKGAFTYHDNDGQLTVGMRELASDEDLNRGYLAESREDARVLYVGLTRAS